MLHKILGWTIGISIIFLGFVYVLSETIFGLSLIITGITFIPLFRDWLRKKTKRNISSKSRQILYSVVGMFLVAIFINSVIQKKNITDKEFKAKIEKERLESIKRKAEILKNKAEEFKTNKEKILSKIKEFKNTKNYSDALTLANNFVFTNDKDLLELKEELQTIQNDIQNKLRTEAILSKLKILPASKINENYDLYKELSTLHPNNAQYKKKAEYYNNQLITIEAKKAAEQIFYGNAPRRSNWDGSYYEVEKYLERAMHDPDSLKFENCSQVYKIKEKGWGVLCVYRGKNAFGGMVKNSNWFIIRNNSVVDVKPSDTYNAN